MQPCWGWGGGRAAGGAGRGRVWWRCARRRAPRICAGRAALVGLEGLHQPLAPGPPGTCMLRAGGALPPAPGNGDSACPVPGTSCDEAAGGSETRSPCGSGSAAPRSGTAAGSPGALGASEVLGECGARALAALGVWKAWVQSGSPQAALAQGRDPGSEAALLCSAVSLLTPGHQ